MVFVQVKVFSRKFKRENKKQNKRYYDVATKEKLQHREQHDFDFDKL